IRKGLAQLQKLADILPAIKRLDGEVVCIGNRPVTNEKYHEIWKGLWQNHDPVALKTLPQVDPGPSSRATKRLIREMEVRSRLKHEHIQGFFGITTDINHFICIVSEWRSNGNLLQFVAHTENVNKMHLLSGAASGLAYLHSESVVHGNGEFSTRYPHIYGEALICDFGMAKIVIDVSDTPSTITDTLSKSTSSRWMAPELIHRDEAELTFACDVWSFGMTMLELFTMVKPWAEFKREAHIHRATATGCKPARPEHCPDLTNRMWAVMLGCWEGDPTNRPVIATVASQIQCEDGGIRGYSTSFLCRTIPGRSRLNMPPTTVNAR
ncbi:hypothetical protein FOMPIDRAFT_1126611, partial [Fomitopsis schrenkii]